MRFIRAFILFVALFNTLTASAQEIKKAEEISFDPNAKTDSSKKSINAAAVGTIGDANVIIKYHSPAVRNRVIWGGVVPYDEVWVTGAHSATSLEIDRSFTIGGKTLPAGKYALFTIPGKTSWTVIINKNWEQHLADDYDKKDDIVRIQVVPTQQAKSLERLQYFVKREKGNQGSIAFAWDKLRIEFELAVLK
jgi:hypothetical protein